MREIIIIFGVLVVFIVAIFLKPDLLDEVSAEESPVSVVADAVKKQPKPESQTKPEKSSNSAIDRLPIHNLVELFRGVPTAYELLDSSDISLPTRKRISMQIAPEANTVSDIVCTLYELAYSAVKKENWHVVTVSSKNGNGLITVTYIPDKRGYEGIGRSLRWTIMVFEGNGRARRINPVFLRCKPRT